ncbi:MAG: hypothetical protein WBQ68_16580 [Terriglobales bacterium]
MADTGAGGATGSGMELGARVTAPHLLQNGAVTGVPQVLQNRATGAAGGLGIAAGGWADAAAPHLLQNTPLTGDPHLLQKLAM